MFIDWKYQYYKDVSFIILRFNAIPNPNHNPNRTFFGSRGRPVFKFIWKCRKPGIAKAILEKKWKDLTLPFIKAHYKVTVIKTVNAKPD